MFVDEEQSFRFAELECFLFSSLLFLPLHYVEYRPVERPMAIVFLHQWGWLSSEIMKGFADEVAVTDGRAKTGSLSRTARARAQGLLYNQHPALFLLFLSLVLDVVMGRRDASN